MYTNITQYLINKHNKQNTETLYTDAHTWTDVHANTDIQILAIVNARIHNCLQRNQKFTGLFHNRGSIAGHVHQEVCVF